MRLPVRASVLVCLPLAFSLTTARAATVTTSDLPGPIQSCIAVATCFVSNVSSYDSGTASAFQMSQVTGTGSPDNDWLMRYTLAAPSGQSGTNWFPSESFSGYLWMVAPSSYSAAQSFASFTVYLDKVSPTPNSMNYQNGVINLDMSTADVLAGTSYRTTGLDYNNNSYSYGNLGGNIPGSCVSPGCESHAQINLAQLTYTNFGYAIYLTAFNPSDTRGLVYTQSSSYPGYNGDPSTAVNGVQSFYISAVPVPAAAWLFGSGLLGLMGVVRRKIA